MGASREATGPLLCAAVTAAGALAAGALPAGPGHTALAVGALAAVAGAVVRVGRSALLLVALGALALAAGLRAHHGVESNRFTADLDGRVVVAEVQLVSEPTWFSRTAAAVVRVGKVAIPDRGRWEPVGDRHLHAVAQGSDASALLVLEAGDRVVVRGLVGPLDDHTRARRDLHVVARLEVVDVLDARGPSAPVFALANRVRRLVLRGNDRLPPEERALLAGFLVGDTRGLSDETTDDFRAAGLGHLLAVSGANVVFVLALLSPVSRRLGLRGRLVAGVAVLGVFAVMTRLEPSVLRAVTMAGIGMTASYFGRPAPGLRVLGIAATALLLADPFLVHSVAFRLSCGASAGILLWSSPLRARCPGPVWLREVGSTTLAAQLGVAPVLLPTFGSMPLVAMPANLVAAPLAAPLTVWGLGAGAVGGLAAPWVPELALLLHVPSLVLLRGISWVAAAAAKVPAALDPTAAWMLLAAVTSGMAARRWATGRLGTRWRRRSASGTAPTTSPGVPW